MMDLPIFNGAKYKFIGYFVLDDEQMKNYPWELPSDGEEDEDQPDEEKEDKSDGEKEE